MFTFVLSKTVRQLQHRTTLLLSLKESDLIMKTSIESMGVSEADVLDYVKTDEKSDLDESEMTVHTETGSTSEEEGTSGWFGGMGSDFRVLATSFKDTAGGVASFVHRSALSVAAEIASLELDDGDEEQCDRSSTGAEVLRLPWEVKTDEDTYEEDTALKEKIASLASKQSTFLQPFSTRHTDDDDGGQEEEEAFVLDEQRIKLIRHLLDLDETLSTTHARLSGRSDIRENIYWQNYFHNCQQARDNHMRQYGSGLDIASGGELSFVCVGDSVTSAPTSLNSDLFQSEDDLVIVDPGASTRP